MSTTAVVPHAFSALKISVGTLQGYSPDPTTYFNISRIIASQQRRDSLKLRNLHATTTNRATLTALCPHSAIAVLLHRVYIIIATKPPHLCLDQLGDTQACLHGGNSIVSFGQDEVYHFVHHLSRHCETHANFMPSTIGQRSGFNFGSHAPLANRAPLLFDQIVARHVSRHQPLETQKPWLVEKREKRHHENVAGTMAVERKQFRGLEGTRLNKNTPETPWKQLEPPLFTVTRSLWSRPSGVIEQKFIDFVMALDLQTNAFHAG